MIMCLLFFLHYVCYIHLWERSKWIRLIMCPHIYIEKHEYIIGIGIQKEKAIIRKIQKCIIRKWSNRENMIFLTLPFKQRKCDILNTSLQAGVYISHILSLEQVLVGDWEEPLWKHLPIDPYRLCKMEIFFPKLLHL